jgi:hypothetical protein
MSVISFAVIGKNRQPIFMKEFVSDSNIKKNTEDDLQWFGIAATASSPTNIFDENRISLNNNNNKSDSRCDCSIRQQFIIHDALDYMEQWIERRNTNTPPQQQNAHDAMFAGLLCPIEDMRVYGKSLP